MYQSFCSLKYYGSSLHAAHKNTFCSFSEYSMLFCSKIAYDNWKAYKKKSKYFEFIFERLYTILNICVENIIN